MKKLLFPYMMLVLLLSSCASYNYNNTVTYDEHDHLNAIVEIPAGTNTKIEYAATTNSFITDQRNGSDRIISYLSYPGNYGFIPGTKTDTSEGGDGDPVDVLILTSHLETGTIIPVKPVGLLKMIDNNELDYKVIAVPVDTKDNVLGIDTYTDFKKKYPSIVNILTNWFAHYDASEKQEIVGWGDHEEALAYIKANTQ